MTAIQSVSVNPESLRAASFAEERHGYSRDEVQALLTAAADALEVAWRENEALTASGVTTEDGEISSRAVLLLSSAQRIADDAVAEAELYAKDLIETARKQYREIVERAQQVAHSIEKQAAAHPGQIAAAATGQVAVAAGGASTAESTAATTVPTPSSAEAWTADRSPSFAFATDDLAAAGPASPNDVVRARQFARMATAQVHSLLEAIERELGRLGASPAAPSLPPVPSAPPVPPAPPAAQESPARREPPVPQEPSVAEGPTRSDGAWRPRRSGN